VQSALPPFPLSAMVSQSAYRRFGSQVMRPNPVFTGQIALRTIPLGRSRAAVPMPAMHILTFDPLIAAVVFPATAATDAIYVRFTSAVVARHRVAAANWSSLWYLLSSYAVISYTNDWIYVLFDAIGSWVGAFVSLTFGDVDHGPVRQHGHRRTRASDFLVCVIDRHGAGSKLTLGHRRMGRNIIARNQGCSLAVVAVTPVGLTRYAGVA
jgi:hypothetical protein